jgi:hypothetical protein
MSGSDAELVEQVRTGDLDAFDELYRRHASAVRVAAEALAGDPQAVPDIVQIAFLRALDQWAALPDPARLGEWVATFVSRQPLEPVASDPAELDRLSSYASRPYAELAPADAQALAMSGYLAATPDQIGSRLGVAAAEAADGSDRAFRRLASAARLAARVQRNRVGAVTVLVSGSGPARELDLRDVLYVGRECAGVAPGERLILADPAVSRLHLELRVDALSGRVLVRDRSRNGTLLNGAELPGGASIVLRDGDTLRVGTTALTLRLGEPASVREAATSGGPDEPGSDVTAFASVPAVTAVARSSGQVPAGLVDRIATAAPLFGAVADQLPGSLLMVRWGGPRAEGERQCARFLDFAGLLAASAGANVEWSVHAR